MELNVETDPDAHFNVCGSEKHTDLPTVYTIFYSVAEPEPVEPKLFRTWSRSRN